jgi:signal transduction histidine kinase
LSLIFYIATLKLQVIRIPFKVSARTAKLIGQENFSNPEGAVIELVKNCYDADAKACIVIFDIMFDKIPESLLIEDFKKLSGKSEIIKTSYKLSHGKYQVIENPTEERTNELTSFFHSFNSIYIIDNGEGMTKSVIEDDWMEIGTGNKEIKYTSDNGRVKTGAKGIGRFALDRLGLFTEMWTVPKDKSTGKGFYWSIDWKQFDIPNKSIFEIEADLEQRDLNLKSLIQSNFKNHSRLQHLIKSTPFTNGTIIKVSKLKDNWTENGLQSVFKNLEALIPPKELAIPFTVNFYHLQNLKSFGNVETAYFNDYDYKIFAEFDSDALSVKLTITRNELDLKKVKNEFAYIFKNANPPYDLKTLEKREFQVNKSANEILKWEKNNENQNILRKIGNFSFSFYFLKSVVLRKDDYPYKSINQKERDKILEKFGGIKIYRDSFRVRPYGDIGNDWLKLGERAALSPAGAGQRIGQWRVNPYQIAGIINISRFKNLYLVDKSDRGGLQENETFAVFKSFITAIIYEFEIDRSKILNPFYEDSRNREKKNRENEIRNEAEKLANRIILEREKFEQKKELDEKKAYQRVISKSLKKFERTADEDAEIAQIRTLASLGLIVSSFAHELKTAKNNFEDIDELEIIFKRIVPKESKSNLDFIDGINIIESLKEENQKIAHWVDYSLNAIKKDKRKRTVIKLDKYFAKFSKTWDNVLSTRNIELQIKNNVRRNYVFKAFEMDLNTIFNNLIANSIDAFKNVRKIYQRKIIIDLSLLDARIEVIYCDNGTGVPAVFKRNKDEIFLPFTTSKKDQQGNNIGTGLGMYLVKTVVLDNNGTIEIMESKTGFKLRIELPIRNK